MSLQEIRLFEIDRSLQSLNERINLYNTRYIPGADRSRSRTDDQRVRDELQTIIENKNKLLEEKQNIIDNPQTQIKSAQVQDLINQLRTLEAQRAAIPRGFLSSSSAGRADADRRLRLRSSLDKQIADITAKLRIAVEKAESQQKLTTQDVLTEKPQTQEQTQSNGINPLILLGGIGLILL